MNNKTLMAIIIVLMIPVALGMVNYKNNGETQYITETLVLTDNAAGASLPRNIDDGYLFSVEINSTADDIVVFSIASRHGTVLYTTTTTGAIAGEIENPSGYWVVNEDDGDSSGDAPTYTLSGLGSGTVYIDITTAKK